MSQQTLEVVASPAPDHFAQRVDDGVGLRGEAERLPGSVHEIFWKNQGGAHINQHTLYALKHTIRREDGVT